MGRWPAILVLLAAAAAGGEFDLEKEARRIEAVVAQALGSEFRRRVPLVVADEEFFFDLNHYWYTRTRDHVDAKVSLWRKLAVVGEDYDVREVARRHAPAGFYTPARICIRKDFVPPRGSKFRARHVLAHELIHAHRDQHGCYDRLTWSSDVPDQDWAYATRCLGEGDAELLSGWIADSLIAGKAAGSIAGALRAAEYPARSERQRRWRTQQREDSAVANYVYAPYDEGARFAFELYRKGGLDALRQAFARPPRSMEQVLHPEKYAGKHRDEPQVFHGGDVLELLGEGWRRVYANTFGEFDVRATLQSRLGARIANRAAAGWDGGLVRLYAPRKGPPLLTLITTWDSPDDATEFAQVWCEWAGRANQGEFTVSITPTVAGERRELDTPGGRVVLVRRGHDVVLLDGVPQGVAPTPLLVRLWTAGRRERREDERPN